jgi:hypothetical protein
VVLVRPEVWQVDSGAKCAEFVEAIFFIESNRNSHYGPSLLTNYWSLHPINLVLTDIKSEIPITVFIIDPCNRVSMSQCITLKNYTVLLKDIYPEKGRCRRAESQKCYIHEKDKNYMPKKNV